MEEDNSESASSLAVTTEDVADTETCSGESGTASADYEGTTAGVLLDAVAAVEAASLERSVLVFAS